MPTQSDTFNHQFAPFKQCMKQENLPDIAIDTFAHYYQHLLKGQTGFITEADIDPVESLPDAEEFSEDLAKIGEDVLAKTVLVKLNGGLGTSMGLNQAKSLLKVKNSLSFLDIIARQAMQANIPLVLMNSFVTHDDSLAALAPYSNLQVMSFLQHKVPKIRQDDLSPVVWPKDPTQAWCPPGHGDIYTALISSGMLDTLLDKGYRYAFVSNVDNLGAVIDTAILGYFAKSKSPFMMEAADRTVVDKKGGHLAQQRDGQFILRESAQCPPEEESLFQDINRYKYFNCNSLWLDLVALKETMATNNNILGLPMIRNTKTVDPRDESSPKVYQLETAMGSAIAVFPNAQAIRVPRTRFSPVKTTEDLLAVRSDAYLLTDDFCIVPNPARQASGLVSINLDPAYYKLISDLEARFPDGPPSLIECERLEVKGDIKFGGDVVFKGEVVLVNEGREQMDVEDILKEENS